MDFKEEKTGKNSLKSNNNKTQLREEDKKTYKDETGAVSLSWKCNGDASNKNDNTLKEKQEQFLRKAVIGLARNFLKRKQCSLLAFRTELEILADQT